MQICKAFIESAIKLALGSIQTAQPSSENPEQAIA